MHDSSTLNRQGNDHGTQYRSAVFFANEEQRRAAAAAAREEEERTGKQVVTKLEPESDFFLAEEYHQAYLAKGGQSADKGETAPIRCYG